MCGSPGWRAPGLSPAPSPAAGPCVSSPWPSACRHRAPGAALGLARCSPFISINSHFLAEGFHASVRRGKVAFKFSSYHSQ